MFQLSIETHFSAAHRLREYQGKCERLHGHNYRVEVVLCGETLDRLGMLMDFQDGKGIVRDVVGRMDHQYLNEIPPFDKLNPTAEQVARQIAEEIGARLPVGVRVASVTCWESESCGARYVPD
jgi:6-pyruvoyltetrahydropterin/6-carboxytetrahydropterin synthase